MLAHLIRKEILEHLLSLRFVVLTLIGAVSVTLSLVSGLGYYHGLIDDYQAAQQLAEQHLRNLAEADQVTPWTPTLELNFNPYLANLPPTVMAVFVRGVDPGLGRTIRVWGERANERPKLSPLSLSPILSLLPSLDLLRAVEVLFALLVLIFTFDAVSGEKERGTLRLLSSYPVPRDRILLAKFVGSLVPVAVALVLPMLCGVAAVLLFADVAIESSALLRLGLVLLAALVYLTVFACAGLFASAAVHRSGAAFAACLAFWAFSAVILPKVSLIAADVIRPASSTLEYLAEVSRLGRERLEKHRQLRKEWRDAHSTPGQEWWQTTEGQEAYRMFYHNARYTADASVAPQMRRAQERFENLSRSRLDLAMALSNLSPTFALRTAASRAAGTGLQRNAHFLAAYDQHWRKDTEWYRDSTTKLELQRINPEKYGEPRWGDHGRPRFVYAEAWSEAGVDDAVLHVGVIAVWGILFFAAAYVFGRRLDVR